MRGRAPKVRYMPLEDEAHWALLGEAIVAFVRRKHHFHVGPFPRGLHPVPGPLLIMGERFIDSPVGPFLSLAIGEPVRLGVRPGYFFGISVLNAPEARRAGRQYWGFPHELGTLHWNSDTGVRSLEWEERSLRLEAVSSSRPFPLLVPIRTLQRRTDGLVIVPTRLRALTRKARVTVDAAEGDDLVDLRGSHRGWTLSGMVVRRGPARRASGIWSTLRAPLRAPEPGVAGMSGSEMRHQTPNVVSW